MITFTTLSVYWALDSTACHSTSWWMRAPELQQLLEILRAWSSLHCIACICQGELRFVTQHFLLCFEEACPSPHPSCVGTVLPWCIMVLSLLTWPHELSHCLLWMSERRARHSRCSLTVRQLLSLFCFS